MKRASCALMTVFVKSRPVVASHRVHPAAKSTAIWRVPNALAAARDGAWRRARNCHRFAAGSPARTATAVPVDRPARAATPVPRRVIAALRVANRVPVAKAVVQPTLTAVSVAASRVLRPELAAIAPQPPAVAGHQARARAIAPVVIKPARKVKVTIGLRVRADRRVRVAIVRRVQADRKVRAALARRAVVDVRRVTGVDARRAAAVAVVAAAIDPVIAELRLGVTSQGV